MANAPRKKEPAKEAVDEAIAYERQIAEDAAKIRAEAEVEAEPFMDRALFLRLWPLLTKPIPEGFLLTVSAGDGKPYPSTGIRSVQVQKNRLDNVLTPLWWSEHRDYHDDGKLCKVTVTVHDPDGACLVSREAWGGVDRGNTVGNRYKGSYTNAAKQAFAQIGPGREVYIGATDHDPDVDVDAAKQQSHAPRVERDEARTQMVDVEAELQRMLAHDDGLQPLRRQANEAMASVGAPDRQRLRELKSAPGRRELEELLARVNAAADEHAAHAD